MKAKYLVYAKIGLVDDRIWEGPLENYPTDLVCSIRKQLMKNIPGLTEKFNTNSRYFGYSTGTDKDRAYIYVQKKGLRIDLHISRDFEANLKEEGFEVHFVNNFQGRAGWLTGWRVPYTTSIERVMKWLLKAFNEAGKMAKNQPNFCWHHGEEGRLRQCLDNGYCDIHPLGACCSKWWKGHKLKRGDRVRFSVKGKVVAFGTIQSEPYDLFAEKGIEPVDPKWLGAVDIGDIYWRDGGDCSSPPRRGSHRL